MLVNPNIGQEPSEMQEKSSKSAEISFVSAVAEAALALWIAPWLLNPKGSE